MPKTTEELYKELLEQGKQYQQQANDYLSAYDNRGQFSYDAENDPMYQSLKNQYVHQGRRAMEDTMGQAAGLTGGYGSTYAQGVGNQAYNEYLTQLNGQIAGLAQQARANWDAEGDRMLDRYNLALNAANTAYGQARDALGDLRYDKEYADSQAYQQWQMNRADQSDARSYAEMMIKMGLMPSSDVLAAAGWSEADVKRMVDYYKQMQAQAASGGGYSSGGSRGSGGSSGGGNGTGNEYETGAENPYMSGIVGAAIGATAATGAQNITDAQVNELYQYALANGPDALQAYMYQNYKNSPNFDAVLKRLKQMLVPKQSGPVQNPKNPSQWSE